jgi:hypothetical protein
MLRFFANAARLSDGPLIDSDRPLIDSDKLRIGVDLKCLSDGLGWTPMGSDQLRLKV